MPSLRVTTADGVKSLPITTAPITVGRSESCDIILRADGEVSREHASIWLDERGVVMVTDRDSKNGTRVDDGPPFRGGTYPARRRVRIGEHLIDLFDVTRTDDSPGPVRFVNAPEEVPGGNTQYFASTRRPDLTNQQRLNALIALTERIGGVFEKSVMLEQALDACIESLGFERGLLVLKSQRGEPEQPIARNMARDETGAFRVSRTLINRALMDGERAVVNNPATDLVNNLSESLVRFPICSALCVPIMHRNEILGVIYGDRVTRAKSHYESDDVDFLAAIAQQVGVGIANQRLLAEHVKNQKFVAALEQARTIQRRLLPSAPLRQGRVTVEGYNQASALVGGDYYDYFPLNDRSIGMVIADVSGHGLPAALLMANFQAAVRAALTEDVSLPDVAARINRLMLRNTANGLFITALLGRIDAHTGEFEYVSAGHPGPLLLSSSGTKSLADDETCNALPFGICSEDDYPIRKLAPTPGLNAALFFTDGLSEASAPDGSLLGVQSVMFELAKLPNHAPPMLLSAALTTVRNHVSTPAAVMDDLTLLAMQFEPS
ncbi:MAG: SpoIIE family protein phosphatase [Phycisphaerae bacterium]|nr:SpoIIE family protein phosphatase [Phycisphaerae bacterium]